MIETQWNANFIATILGVIFVALVLLAIGFAQPMEHSVTTAHM